MDFAPRQPSSAGWKMSFEFAAPVFLASVGTTLATPRPMAVCPSWPQACAFGPGASSRSPRGPAGGRPRCFRARAARPYRRAAPRSVRPAGVVGADDAGEPVAQPRDPRGIGPVAERFGAGGGDFGCRGDFHARLGPHDLGAGGDLPAEFFQRGGDRGGGAELAETELGVAVKITAPAGEIGRGKGKRGHGGN